MKKRENAKAIKPFLILIAGGTGSGKTTVAEMITKQSGKRNVLLLSVDNYYKDLSHLPFKEREKVNFDHPDAIEWNLLKKHLTLLLNGKTIKMPIYNFRTHTREKYINVRPKKIIILEGIFALYDNELNKLAKLRIFVETDSDVRFIRRLKRDIKERGRTVGGVIRQWLNTIKPMHDKFIEPTRRNAHIIIPEDPDGKMRGTAVELIKTKIKSLLRN
jgi:uridine kinase